MRNSSSRPVSDSDRAGEIVIRRLDAVTRIEMDQLAELTVDVVDSGASVGFMLPFSQADALEFWRVVAREVATKGRLLIVAEDEQGICGTVQLVLDVPNNQPHRADLAKMQVHRRARRQGLGRRLLQEAERAAREMGKTLLVLDAVTGGDAARLYERCGWTKVGDIPAYALMPDGVPCGTTYYYKALGGVEAETSSPGACP